MTLALTLIWITEKLNLKEENLDNIKSLSLPGRYDEKISSLGTSLFMFSRLKNLDLSRNALSSLDGMEALAQLETLNLYYNCVDSLTELLKLRKNSRLQELDVRLNPVSRSEPDYRLYLIQMLPDLKRLDDRSIAEGERNSALMHFTSDQVASFTQTRDSASVIEDSEDAASDKRGDHHLASPRQRQWGEHRLASPSLHLDQREEHSATSPRQRYDAAYRDWLMEVKAQGRWAEAAPSTPPPPLPPPAPGTVGAAAAAAIRASANGRFRTETYGPLSGPNISDPGSLVTKTRDPARQPAAERHRQHGSEATADSLSESPLVSESEEGEAAPAGGRPLYRAQQTLPGGAERQPPRFGGVPRLVLSDSGGGDHHQHRQRVLKKRLPRARWEKAQDEPPLPTGTTSDHSSRRLRHPLPPPAPLPAASTERKQQRPLSSSPPPQLPPSLLQTEVHRQPAEVAPTLGQLTMTQPQHSQMKMCECPGLDLSKPCPFLNELAALADQHWNGAGSLGRSTRFQEAGRGVLMRLAQFVRSETAGVEAAALNARLTQLEQENFRLLREVALLGGGGGRARAHQQLPHHQTRHDLLDEATSSPSASGYRRGPSEPPQHPSTASSASVTTPSGGLASQSQVDELIREIDRLKVKLRSLEQVELISSMLQESHKSLLLTNEHLMAELRLARHKDDAAPSSTSVPASDYPTLSRVSMGYDRVSGGSGGVSIARKFVRSVKNETPAADYEDSTPDSSTASARAANGGGGDVGGGGGRSVAYGNGRRGSAASSYIGASEVTGGVGSGGGGSGKSAATGLAEWR